MDITLLKYKFVGFCAIYLMPYTLL